MGNQNNLKNCGFVKTILMLLVIFGHACAFWSGHWFTENPVIQSTGLNILYAWVNSFHIYAFALVSGYIFAFKVMRGGTASIFRSCAIRSKVYLCHMSS